MKKIYVLDTNVLLMDPEAIFAFEDNQVMIPLAVVEEIDDQKKKSSDIGYNARQTSRILDELRKKGKLNQGVELNNGGCIRIVIDQDELILPPGLSSSNMDNRIISTAYHLQRKNEESEVVMVSNDINLRLIADALGLKAEEHLIDRLEEDEIYSGIKELKVSGRIIDKLFSEGQINADVINDGELELFPHEMLQLNALEQNQKSALARYEDGKILPLRFSKEHPYGISPRNREQQFAFELLLDPEVQLVTMAGKAGTGKTLLALAAGLHSVVQKKQYKRLLVARPVIPMGKDLGFLPGSKEEKLQPWMQPIFDNLDFIIQSRPGKSYQGLTFEQLVEKDLLQIEALTYIRGRSVPEQFIIVDEAQNLSKHEVKTIVTRAGKDSKIVMTGDPYQIDNPYLDIHNNGLTYLARKFHGQKIAGHIMLEKGERSELAQIASELL